MPTLKKFAVPTLIAASIALLLAQCSGTLLPTFISKKIKLSDDESTFRQELRRHIPVGSSITEAKTTLKLDGFQCTWRKDFGSTDSETNWTGEEADYLFCYLETSQLVCTRTYKPFIYYKNEAVTKVDAAIGGWCL